MREDDGVGDGGGGESVLGGDGGIARTGAEGLAEILMDIGVSVEEGLETGAELSFELPLRTSLNPSFK